MKYGKELIHVKKLAKIVSQNWQYTFLVLSLTQPAVNVPLATWGLFTQVSVASWGLRRFARQQWWGWISSAHIKKLACFPHEVNRTSFLRLLLAHKHSITQHPRMTLQILISYPRV